MSLFIPVVPEASLGTYFIVIAEAARINWILFTIFISLARVVNRGEDDMCETYTYLISRRAYIYLFHNLCVLVSYFTTYFLPFTM